MDDPPPAPWLGGGGGYRQSWDENSQVEWRREGDAGKVGVCVCVCEEAVNRDTSLLSATGQSGGLDGGC